MSDPGTTRSASRTDAWVDGYIVGSAGDGSVRIAPNVFTPAAQREWLTGYDQGNAELAVSLEAQNRKVSTDA